jgi:hypothetical protein
MSRNDLQANVWPSLAAANLRRLKQRDDPRRLGRQ